MKELLHQLNCNNPKKRHDNLQNGFKRWINWLPVVLPSISSLNRGTSLTQTNLKWVRQPTPPSDWPCLLSTHQYCSEMADHLLTKDWERKSESLSSYPAAAWQNGDAFCTSDSQRAAAYFCPRPGARLGRKTINVSWLKNGVYLPSLLRGDKQ